MISTYQTIQFLNHGMPFPILIMPQRLLSSIWNHKYLSSHLRLSVEFIFILHNTERLMQPLHLRMICWRKEKWAIVCLLPISHLFLGQVCSPQGILSCTSLGCAFLTLWAPRKPHPFRLRVGTGATDTSLSAGHRQARISEEAAETEGVEMR